MPSARDDGDRDGDGDDGDDGGDDRNVGSGRERGVELD